MMWLIGALTSRLRRWLAAVAAVVAVIGVAWLRGRKSAQREAEARAQRRRADDMERIAQDMAESGGDRPDAALEWLRRFGGRD